MEIDQSQQIIKRAAFDIGSGSTKMQISDVHISKKSIVNTYFGEERPVGFGFDLMGSKDGNLSEEIQKVGIQTVLDLKNIAVEQGVTSFAAIATEVFRKAKNGSQYLDKIRALGIHVILVAQDLEAELGFSSALAMAGISPEAGHNYCVWDSGGASFQITYKSYSSSSPSSSIASSSADMQAFMGSIGTSVSLKIFLEEVRSLTMNQPLTSDTTNSQSNIINPISNAECELFISRLIAKLSSNNEVPTWLKNRELVIAASGSNSLFKLCCRILMIEQKSLSTGHITSVFANDSVNASAAATTASTYHTAEVINRFTLTDAEKVLQLCLNHTDEELLKYQQFAYAEGTHVIIPKLALLVAVMRHTGVQVIQSVDCVGSCAGLICDHRFWS